MCVCVWFPHRPPVRRCPFFSGGGGMMAWLYVCVHVFVCIVWARRCGGRCCVVLFYVCVRTPSHLPIHSFPPHPINKAGVVHFCSLLLLFVDDGLPTNKTNHYVQNPPHRPSINTSGAHSFPPRPTPSIDQSTQQALYQQYAPFLALGGVLLVVLYLKFFW